MKTLFDGIRAKAVLIGLAVDIGGTFAFFFAFAVLGSVVLTSTGREVEELDAYSKTTTFMVVSSFAGLLFSSLGGYVSARIAGKAELRNALATGLLSVVTGLFFLIQLPGSELRWFDLLALVLIPPFSVLGGYACLRSRDDDSPVKS